MFKERIICDSLKLLLSLLHLRKLRGNCSVCYTKVMNPGICAQMNKICPIIGSKWSGLGCVKNCGIVGMKYIKYKCNIWLLHFCGMISEISFMCSAKLCTCYQHFPFWRAADCFPIHYTKRKNTISNKEYLDYFSKK